jgi:hypothetical protein
MADLSAVAIGIDMLGKSVTLRRFPAAVDQSDGRVTVGSPTETVIKAVVQPFASNSTAENKMDLRGTIAEGTRIEDYVVVWSRSEIRNVDEDAGTPEDHIEVPGRGVFRVVSVEPRDDGGFYRAVAGLTYDRGRSL